MFEADLRVGLSKAHSLSGLIRRQTGFADASIPSVHDRACRMLMELDQNFSARGANVIGCRSEVVKERR